MGLKAAGCIGTAYIQPQKSWSFSLCNIDEKLQEGLGTWLECKHLNYNYINERNMRSTVTNSVAIPSGYDYIPSVTVM